MQQRTSSMKTYSTLTYLFIISMLTAYSCETPNPNTTTSGVDNLKSLEVKKSFEEGDLSYEDSFYVPIYSDVYVSKQNQKVLLAATLSIRNTSLTEDLFVSKIDYYNTEGALVKKFIKNTIKIAPMATVNYVIDKDDDTGGPGANFIVDIAAKNLDTSPIIQAIMISQVGPNSFSFMTDAFSLRK